MKLIQNLFLPLFLQHWNRLLDPNHYVRVYSMHGKYQVETQWGKMKFSFKNKKQNKKPSDVACQLIFWALHFDLFQS